MDHDEIRDQIESATMRQPSEMRRMASWLLLACWPGGHEDRAERGAVGWLRYWQPERLGITLPDCSCESGRCLVCN